MNLEQIRYCMEQKGYSYGKVAELSGISEETIEKIFSLKEEGTKEIKEALTKVLLPPDPLKEIQEYGNNNMFRRDVVKESESAYQVRQGRYTVADYYAIPDGSRAELLDGVIYDMAAPDVVHQFFITKILLAFDRYITGKKGGCKVFPAPTDVQLDYDDRTMLQPDIVVVCDSSKIFRRCIMGAPDLIVEVLSPFSEKMDSKLKMEKYKNAGVREYWIVDPRLERTYVCWTENEDMMVVYGPEDNVPAGIFGGELTIPMKEIFAEAGKLMS